MQVRPNQTTVEGEVVNVTPAGDGFGAEVTVMVTRNLSEAPEDDFLRPGPGTRLTAFAAEPGAVAEHKRYRLRLRLNAGPGGGRVVVQAADTPSPAPRSSRPGPRSR